VSSNDYLSKVTLYKTLSPFPIRKHLSSIGIHSVEAGKNRTSQKTEGHAATAVLKTIFSTVNYIMRIPSCTPKHREMNNSAGR
jgi:hypothetical protein